MRKLSKYMNKDKLKFFASGIFYSKLSYCLPVFGNVFGLNKYKEENTRYISYTKGDNNRLQILQNKLNRLLLEADPCTPTSQLLQDTGSLSVQQMIAHQTVVMAYKIINSKKPDYLARKLRLVDPGRDLRGTQGMIIPPAYSLGISREGFLFRAATLMNMMDENLRREPSLEKFKTDAKNWVKQNILIKPLPSQIFRDTIQVDRNQVEPIAAAPNLITRYFHPVQNQAPQARQATRQTFLEQFFMRVNRHNQNHE